MTEPSLPDEILDHYANRKDEDARLRGGQGRLEFARVQEIVRRNLPEGPQRILDVGGATGVHAEWLLADGHQVHLIDPVPSHVARATESLGANPAFSAAVGDARRLPAPDASYDVVLLFGPLYHLLDRNERLTAWREAARAVVPGGLVFATAISRFASLFEGLAQERIFDPAFAAMAERDLATGQHLVPPGNTSWGTTAYFHRPDDLREEASAAGLEVRDVVGVEGLAGWLGHLGPRWDDAADREAVLRAARATEHEPTLMGLSAHLVTVARKGA